MSYLGQQLGQGQAERFVFTASGGETSVTTSDDGRAVAYTVGQVDVYLNGAKLINGSDFTATTGTSITGLSALTASDVVEVFALSIFQASDTVSAASGGTFNGNVTMAANLSFGDNNKAIFGAGSDLQIYHSGTHSYIQDSGTGSLRLVGADIEFLNEDFSDFFAKFANNGAATFYYDGSAKLATTSAGIDVTGTVTADGLAVATSSAVTAQLGRDGSDGDVLQIYNGAIGTTKALALGVDFTSGIIESQFGNIDIKAGSALAAKFASGGDISFYEDTGTTPKFFWDASAERLGIGDSSPDGILDVEGSITIAGSQAGVIFNPSVTPANNNVGSIGLVSGTLNAPASVNASSKISGLRVAPTTSGSFNGAGEVAGVKVETFNGQSATLATGLYVDAPTGGDVNYAAILNGGNVGIGTSSPDGFVDINQPGTNANDGLFIYSGDNPAAGGLVLYKAGSALGAIQPLGASGQLSFNTFSGAEAMRIDSSGNLLVGTTSTGLDLSTNASGLIYEPSNFLCIATTVGGNSNIILNKTNSSAGTCVDIRYNGNIVGTIQNTASSTSYNTSSDYRLKDVDGPITNSGAYIDALKPVQGSWKADGSRFIGLIAHEVQEVSETPIATGEKDGEEMQGMDYSAPELIANLIAEIQSLRARVAQLEGA